MRRHVKPRVTLREARLAFAGLEGLYGRVRAGADLRTVALQERDRANRYIVTISAFDQAILPDWLPQFRSYWTMPAVIAARVA